MPYRFGLGSAKGNVLVYLTFQGPAYVYGQSTPNTEPLGICPTVDFDCVGPLVAPASSEEEASGQAYVPCIPLLVIRYTFLIGAA